MSRRPFFRLLLCWFSLAVILLCSGCGETKLDVASEQSFAKTFEKIHNALPETDRPMFRYYFLTALQESVPISFSQRRRIPDYEEIIKLHSLIMGHGNQEEKDLFQNLNGLTGMEIAQKGKDILRKELEGRAARLASQQAETKDVFEAYKKFLEEKTKVKIELGPEVEVREAQGAPRKGSVGFLVTMVTIENASSEKLVGFERHNVDFVDDQGNSVEDVFMSNINGLVANDGSQPFVSGKGGGLAPGATITGQVISKVGGLSRTNPYPPKKKYFPVLAPEKLEPIFEGESEKAGYEAQRSEEKLGQITKELGEVKAEIAEIK